jgi:putative hydrolase of the HAD superfamily
MIEVVVFDLDDTLFPEHQFVLSGFRALDCWLEEQQGIAGFFKKAKNYFKDGVKGNIFNLVLDDIGIDYDNSFILKLLGIYRAHSPRLSLYEDAKWAVSHFQNKQLGLITDGYHITQRSKINALMLDRFFNIVICTDEFGRVNWKPSSFSYKKIMHETGRAGKQCIYIGDNPLKDFVTCRKLGWKTVQICRRDGVYNNVVVEDGYEADVCIDSLYELKGII